MKEEIFKHLDAIGEKLGVAAQHLYAIYVRQSMVEGYMNMIIVGIALVVFASAVWFFRKGMLMPKTDHRYAGPEYPNSAVTFMVISGIVGFFAFGCICGYFTYGRAVPHEPGVLGNAPPVRGSSVSGGEMTVTKNEIRTATYTVELTTDEIVYLLRALGWAEATRFQPADLKFLRNAKEVLSRAL